MANINSSELTTKMAENCTIQHQTKRSIVKLLTVALHYTKHLFSMMPDFNVIYLYA